MTQRDDDHRTEDTGPEPFDETRPDLAPGETLETEIDQDPDFARGERQLPEDTKIEDPDFAQGQRTTPEDEEDSDFARGQRSMPEDDTDPDFARGQRDIPQ